MYNSVSRTHSTHKQNHRSETKKKVVASEHVNLVSDEKWKWKQRTFCVVKWNEFLKCVCSNSFRGFVLFMWNENACEMRMHVNFICTLIEWSPLLKRKFTPIISFVLWFSSTLALRALQWRWSSQLKMLAFVQNKCRYLYFFYVSGTRTQTLEPGRVCIYNYIHTYKLSTLLSLNLLLNRA